MILQSGFEKDVWKSCKGNYKTAMFLFSKNANLEPYMKVCETLMADSLVVYHHGACKHVLSMVIVPYQGITQTITSLIRDSVRLAIVDIIRSAAVSEGDSYIHSGNLNKSMVMTLNAHYSNFQFDFCNNDATTCVKYGGIPSMHATAPKKHI